MTDETDTLIGQVVEACKRIHDAALSPSGKFVSGKVTCPRCGGKMAYSISRYGKIYGAKCETPKCLDFVT